MHILGGTHVYNLYHRYFYYIKTYILKFKMKIFYIYTSCLSTNCTWITDAFVFLYHCLKGLMSYTLSQNNLTIIKLNYEKILIILIIYLNLLKLSMKHDKNFFLLIFMGIPIYHILSTQLLFSYSSVEYCYILMKPFPKIYRHHIKNRESPKILPIYHNIICGTKFSIYHNISQDLYRYYHYRNKSYNLYPKASHSTMIITFTSL